MRTLYIAFFLTLGLSLQNVLYSQEQSDSLLVEIDSLTSIKPLQDSTFTQVDSIFPTVIEPIEFQLNEAAMYLESLLKNNAIWRNENSSFRNMVEYAYYNYNKPVDTLRNRLKWYAYDSISFEKVKLTLIDSIPLKWLSDSLFYVDTISLDRNPYFTSKTIVHQQIDTSILRLLDTIPQLKLSLDSLLTLKDTIEERFLDTNYLYEKGVKLYEFKNDTIFPELTFNSNIDSVFLANNLSHIYYAKSEEVLMANEKSPFYIVPNNRIPDSLKVAVNVLLDYSYERDSSQIFVSDITGRKIPFWLTEKDEYYRYWVKNSKNDSITIWLGNPERNNISLALEEDVNVERKEQKLIDNVPFTTARPNKNLLALKPLKEIPVYWKKSFSSAFSFNYNNLSNYWAKGGESNFANMLDVKVLAEYNNKKDKTKWTNTGRLSYGSTWTKKQNELRTSTDILELNSKFNKVINEKIDFSSGLYFKTQVARGYNYPDDPSVDPILVSKFLNPGMATLGVGIEYKPDKKTTINFSPLSYKNTFVTDTVKLNDHTVHGIDIDKYVKHEMGGQLVMTSSYTILKDMQINNSLRLFSNYIKNPQNVDVDWELNVEKQISWYMKVRLNLHLIYDDDVLFVVSEEGEPEKKGPRLQHSQFIGLTFSFNLKK